MNFLSDRSGKPLFSSRRVFYNFLLLVLCSQFAFSVPAICLDRLTTDATGQVVLELKRPFRDGTTHIVFTPNCSLRKAVVPKRSNTPGGGSVPHQQQASKQVIADVTDPALIERILAHVRKRGPPAPRRYPPSATCLEHSLA